MKQREPYRDLQPPEPRIDRPAWIAISPFGRICGIEIVEAEGGKARLRMPFREELSQPDGLLHGGVLTTLADSAVAVAIKTRLAEGTRFATVELGMRFQAPVRKGTVEAHARVTRMEGRDIEGEALVYDEEGAPVAVLHSRFRIAGRRDRG